MTDDLRPALVITVPYEGTGSIVFDAPSFEDEQRLRMWLRASRQLERLPAILARLLGDMDAMDETRPA